MYRYNEFIRFQWFFLPRIQSFTIYIIISIPNFQVIKKSPKTGFISIRLSTTIFFFFWLFITILIQMIEY